MFKLTFLKNALRGGVYSFRQGDSKLYSCKANADLAKFTSIVINILYWHLAFKVYLEIWFLACWAYAGGKCKYLKF